MRTALYARFSSDKQNEASIEDQLHRCREWLRAKGDDPDDAVVFSDAAISGASLRRPGFEALLAAVEANEIDRIVVESVDRISRDLHDATGFFKNLAFNGCQLVGVGDGLDSAHKSGRLGFTLKALVGELFLTDLADKTRRGLDGRFRAGKATGLQPYGYRTRPSADGSEIMIAEEEAAVVRDIYRAYADGASFAAIAQRLNERGVPCPRARTRHKDSDRGWATTTVRSLLDNEKYIGRWRYARTEWVKKPGTNHRVPRPRPESEQLVDERPELAIVSDRLWKDVQARREASRRAYSRKPGRAPTRKHYALSGVLRCGTCGSSMSIAGSSRKWYGCQQRRMRGTCDNRESLPEDLARRAVFEELRRHLLRPEALRVIENALARELGRRTPAEDQSLANARRAMEAVQARLENLVEFVAAGEGSDTLRAAIRKTERELQEARAQVAHLEAAQHRPVVIPGIEELRERVVDLEKLLTDDPLQGRELLKALFAGGLRCTPVEDGYRLESDLIPAVLIGPKSETADPAKAGPAVSKRSGDRI